jgi:hypothetical protein
MLLSILAALAVQAAPGPATPAKPAAQPSIRAFSCQTSHPLPTPIQQAPVGKAPRTTPWGADPLHTLGAEPDAAMLRPVLRINHCNDDDVLRLNVSDKAPKATTPVAPQQRGQ